MEVLPSQTENLNLENNENQTSQQQLYQKNEIDIVNFCLEIQYQQQKLSDLIEEMEAERQQRKISSLSQGCYNNLEKTITPQDTRSYYNDYLFYKRLFFFSLFIFIIFIIFFYLILENIHCKELMTVHNMYIDRHNENIDRIIHFVNKTRLNNL
jgi:hypothetical protein